LLKEARKAKKMTQQHLADLIGVTRTQVRNWEIRKNRPSNPKTIAWIAEVLEIDVKDLILFFYSED